MSDLFNIFLSLVNLHQGLPFEKVPNSVKHFDIGCADDRKRIKGKKDAFRASTHPIFFLHLIAKPRLH
ncbi:MAG: hypothetical protein GQ582_08185 [Methyloprofundus sp.]|nr:hypothetical protein [Methyloprofundus sp.]